MLRKGGKLEGPTEDKISGLKNECTERVRRAAKSAQRTDEQMRQHGGARYYRAHLARAALETRLVCANSGPCVNIKVESGPFNARILDASILAVLSRMVSSVQFKEPENSAVVLARGDTSKSAFMRNLVQGAGDADGLRCGAERVLIRLVELAKVCTCRVEWAQTNRVVAKDLWRKWDRQYLATLACFSEQCMTTCSQRFQERREHVLRNLVLREAVYAVFMVGETALEFPASRPHVVGAQAHLPRFELRQLRDVVKLASEASFGAIFTAWCCCLEYVIGVSGGCESTIRLVLNSMCMDPLSDGSGDGLFCEAATRTREGETEEPPAQRMRVGDDSLGSLLDTAAFFGTGGGAASQPTEELFDKPGVPLAERTRPLEQLPFHVAGPFNMSDADNFMALGELRRRSFWLKEQSIARHALRRAAYEAQYHEMRSLRAEVAQFMGPTLQQLKQTLREDEEDEVSDERAMAHLLHLLQPSPQELASVASADAFHLYVRHANFRVQCGEPAAAAGGEAGAARALPLTRNRLAQRYDVDARVHAAPAAARPPAFKMQCTATHREREDGAANQHENCLAAVIDELDAATAHSAFAKIERAPKEVFRDTLWLWTAAHDRQTRWLLPDALPEAPRGAPTPANCVMRALYTEKAAADGGIDLSLKLPPLRQEETAAGSSARRERAVGAAARQPPGERARSRRWRRSAASGGGVRRRTRHAGARPGAATRGRGRVGAPVQPAHGAGGGLRERGGGAAGGSGVV